jgi:O-antigen/teichoic acid export membrane protein
MPKPGNSFVLKQIEKYWELIIHEAPPQETALNVIKFIKFGGAMIFAKLASVSAQVILGRNLGPSVYGQFTIILLLASYFAIPIVNGWGLAFTKLSANSDSRLHKLQSLKSLLLIVSICSILATLTLLTLKNPLSSWLNIDNQTMTLTAAMTLFYSWWTLSKQIAQGFQDWRLYVLIENTWACITLTGVISCVYIFHINLITVCAVFFTGYFFAGLFTSHSILQCLSVEYNSRLTRDIFSHGSFLQISGLVGMATFGIDRILININLSSLDVGIYQSHFLATYGIISTFMTILLTYIFPAFCRDRKNNINTLIQRLNKIQYPFTILISIFVGSIVLWLYEYPVSLPLFACLCIFNAVQFHVQLKTWYISSKGTNATKFALKSQVVFLGTNVIILLVLLPRLGIDAGGISLLLAACVSLVYLIKTEHKHLI